MLHVMRWISSLPLFVFLLTSGCALFSENREPPPSFGPREQVYYSDYEKVWRATQIAIESYPIRINNMDLGVLETDYLKGFKVWMPPHKQGSSGGLSYRLNIRVVKGDVENKKAIRVTIMKDLELQRDFFADKQKLPSDGLEEKAILYRIARELQIDKALQKAQKKSNSK